MTKINPKNPENKSFKISLSPNGSWSVWKWEQGWSGNDDWFLQERFKWRWQARRYVKRLLNNKAEYWPK